MQVTNIFMPLLTVGILLATQMAAIADTRISNGGGGHYDKRGNLFSYEYEVWSNNANTDYTLKVWKSKNYPNESADYSAGFKSAREALDHFDCYYSEKEAICEQMRRESR